MQFGNASEARGGSAVLIVLFCFVCASAGATTVIHESAKLGTTGLNGGWYLGDDQFFGSVFYVDREVQVTAIGGHLCGNGSSSGPLFGAILSLESLYDLPSGSPIDMSEVVASTVFTADFPSTDYRTALSATLPPGYYALVFGTGELGSPSGIAGMLPHPDDQLDLPDALYIEWTGTSWLHAGSHQWDLRFVVEGAPDYRYCDADGYCDGPYIGGVHAGWIHNDPTGCDYYVYYPLLSTNLYIGNGYDITVINGDPWPSDKCGVWVDWNQDGDFYDAEEAISLAGIPGPGPYTGTITPPAWAVLGDTRMRVRIWNYGGASPCGPTEYGEVEDYTVMVGVGTTGYGGGSGTQEDPYLIYTAEHMNAIGASPGDWDNHFRLMADIDLGGFTADAYNIIGTAAEPFVGSFDGNGKSISSFTYTGAGAGSIGMFGRVGSVNIAIKDLWLVDPNVDAGTGSDVGALVGYLSTGRVYSIVSNCHVVGGSIIGYDAVGGLVGNKWTGTISNCSSTCNVSGNRYVGGLLGLNYYGTVLSCSSAGSVSGSREVGGLVGDNVEAGIEQSYSTAEVTGDDYVGGLTGSAGWVAQCYSTGAVSGNGGNVGGLAGYGWQGGTVASFWDVNTSGQADSWVGIGKTTAQMQDPNTFMDVGWDFVGQDDGPSDIWAEPAGGGYPVLTWQLSSLPSLPTFAGGAGAAGDPYLISTAEQLNDIGHNPRLMDAHFRLINDIDLAGIEFFMIGSRLYPFGGTFDGGGYRISNFTHVSTGLDDIGLFSCVDGSDAIVSNLGLINPNVGGGTGYRIGAMIGSLGTSSVTGCYTQGGRVTSSGGSYDGDVGGLVGQNFGAISNCHTSTVISSGGDYIGGMVGANLGTVSDCYATGDVHGDARVGGLVGMNYEAISNCYSTGAIFGTSYVGGLAGRTSEGTVDACFWDMDTSGRGTSAGGTGKTTAEMQTRTTFTGAGWDFVGETVNGADDIWTVNDGQDYPKLIRHLINFVGPYGADFTDFAFFASRWAEICPVECAGLELTGDGTIDMEDFSVVAWYWQADCGNCGGADRTGDGRVNYEDLS
ncbi:MAG: GEVED domain-containing protein, partial [Planctomycetota bacterium]